jgi:hypothetical protein
MTKYALPIGLILIIAAGILRFGLSQSLFGQRFTDGWRWEVNSVGVTGYPNAETGQYIEGTTLADDPVNISIRQVTAETEDAPRGQVNITDHYQTLDPITNAVIWEFTANATVDATTGQYVNGEYQGDYYFLPRNVDRNTTYTITNTSYRSLPMTFQREEAIAGINTYLFGNYEPINNTLAYVNTVLLEDGQEIWCSDFSMEYWVEPISGEIVKFREWCEGDWIVNAQTGEQLAPVSRWGAETTGDDLLRSASRVSAQLSAYNWISFYLPALMVGIGGVVLAIRFLPVRVTRTHVAVREVAS